MIAEKRVRGGKKIEGRTSEREREKKRWRAKRIGNFIHDIMSRRLITDIVNWKIHTKNVYLFYIVVVDVLHSTTATMLLSYIQYIIRLHSCEQNFVYSNDNLFYIFLESNSEFCIKNYYLWLSLSCVHCPQPEPRYATQQTPVFVYVCVCVPYTYSIH